MNKELVESLSVGHDTYPRWWSSKGLKVSLLQDAHYARPAGSVFMIGSRDTDVARLNIFHGPAGRHERRWSMRWKIDHGGGFNEGTREVNDQDLLEMFSHDSGPHATEGLFVRLGPYLNIPHRGSRLYGDPNISIAVGDEMVEAIRELIASGRG